jgi:hypothetical protein
MYILIPGRHHLLTNFQANYLNDLISNGLDKATDVEGKQLAIYQPVKAIIFAVTSANHSGTKRNPLPFYLRAMGIQNFANSLPTPSYVFGIGEVGRIDSFAEYTVKQIRHQSDYAFDLNPSNTLILCSTPVLQMYKKIGYTVLPAELCDLKTLTYHQRLPWYWVEKIGETDDWEKSKLILEHVHPCCLELWKKYNLGEKVRKILTDPIIGEDGDMTVSRDYNSYVRQMDQIAELKFTETAPFIQSGNIGDIGCAVGSWIKHACATPRLAESDFYGIEVVRQLYDICIQRKNNNEFANPYTFFGQKNAVTELVFRESTMNTIHTSSLTHEIASYGNIHDLHDFIANRYKELVSGGVWINRDVVGPENGDEQVLMLLKKEDGINTSYDQQLADQNELKLYLEKLSTFSRFLRFANDFRKVERDQIIYEIVRIDNLDYISLRLEDACEFILSKDYTDNWRSEMHERFCFWSFNDWKEQLMKAGFEIGPGSGAYTNPWIEENRIAGKVELFKKVDGYLKKLSAPPTNMLIVGKKI